MQIIFLILLIPLQLGLMNIPHRFINMYMQWEEKTVMRLCEPGAKESKISGGKHKFLLQKKRGKYFLNRVFI